MFIFKTRYFADTDIVGDGDYYFMSWLKRFLFYLPTYSIGAFLGNFYGKQIFEGKYANRWLSVIVLPIFLMVLLFHNNFGYILCTIFSILYSDAIDVVDRCSAESISV